jgi:hypothetical protein
LDHTLAEFLDWLDAFGDLQGSNATQRVQELEVWWKFLNMIDRLGILFDDRHDEEGEGELE